MSSAPNQPSGSPQQVGTVVSATGQAVGQAGAQATGQTIGPAETAQREWIEWVKRNWGEALIIPAVVGLVALYFHTKSKLEAVDDRFTNFSQKLEIENSKRFETFEKRIDEAIKNLATASQKRDQENSDLMAGIVAEKDSAALICSDDFESAIGIVRRYTNSIKPRLVPDVLKRGIYTNLLSSAIGSGEILTLRDEDLAEYESEIIKDDRYTCNDRAYSHLACCFLALNNRSKAKRMAFLGIDKTMRRGYDGHIGELQWHYATLIFVAAADGDGLTKAQREASAWSLLSDTFDRMPIPPSWIENALDSQFMNQVLTAARATQPEAVKDAILAVKSRLRNEIYVISTPRTLPNGRMGFRYTRVWERPSVEPKAAPKIESKEKSGEHFPQPTYSVSCCQ